MSFSRSRSMILTAFLLSPVACAPSATPAPSGPAVASRPPAAAITPSIPPQRPAPAAPVASAAPAPDLAPVIVIHEAELFGELHARAGKTVTIASKVITTRTEPEVGNKGLLMQRLDDSSTDVWVPVADVVVKSKLDKQARISVTITDEKKSFPDGKKLVAFAPKSRMRLRWEWQ